MFKFVHWIVVSRSSMVQDLLAMNWEKEFRVKIERSSIEELKPERLKGPASLIIVDLATIDVQSAYQLQRAFDKSNPHIRFVFIHFPESADAGLLLQCANVAGVFPLSTVHSEISAGLKEISNGVVVIPLKVQESLERSESVYDNERLTAREREVLKALLSGDTNLDIANSLYVSESTIKTHLYRAFRKIGVSSRGQAIAWAQRNIHEVHV
ncbi:response regulator transcription factor [Shewanella gelidii]|uniref:Helix-turn-helix transcriptional regulator n=1 Tax=Shewanella gelidii TaxID=1642821 RepID=A0A917JTU2_9GAMM|nr:response regulator transcription factor [Shewanella gelidii]MCL1098336.1 response regulator transcription factor [Shewanella gelidii]GGI84470.1 helix-turn-helix transcriptional regulator [Shewanella gelidii]